MWMSKQTENLDFAADFGAHVHRLELFAIQNLDRHFLTSDFMDSNWREMEE